MHDLPQIGAINRLPDNNFALTVTGEDGRQYSLRTATDVSIPTSQWTALQSGVQFGGSLTLTDLTATNYPQRFYLISSP